MKDDESVACHWHESWSVVSKICHFQLRQLPARASTEKPGEWTIALDFDVAGLLGNCNVDDAKILTRWRLV
jgi:hypothetical protein